MGPCLQDRQRVVQNMRRPGPQTQPAQQAAAGVGHRQARLLAEPRADRGPRLAQPVDQAVAEGTVAGPDAAVEQLGVAALEAVAATVANMSDEPGQDVALDLPSATPDRPAARP